jgi:plasmid stabilization system protein ParE
MDYRVMLSAQADHDLEDVVRFLAQKSPAAGERLGYALLDEALSLAKLPRRGGLVQARPGYRRIVHQPWFLIYYRIDEVRGWSKSPASGTAVRIRRRFHWVEIPQLYVLKLPSFQLRISYLWPALYGRAVTTSKLVRRKSSII